MEAMQIQKPVGGNSVVLGHSLIPDQFRLFSEGISEEMNCRNCTRVQFQHIFRVLDIDKSSLMLPSEDWPAFH